MVSRKICNVKHYKRIFEFSLIVERILYYTQQLLYSSVNAVHSCSVCEVRVGGAKKKKQNKVLPFKKTKNSLQSCDY